MIKKLSIVLPVLLFVLIACNNDENDYPKARQENTLHAYEKFVSRHPESRFIESANAKIDSLRYEIAVSNDNYEKFIEEYPGSGFYDTVLELLVEQRNFNEAKSKDTVAGYKEFLEKHPTGKYCTLAQARLKLLELPKVPEMYTLKNDDIFSGGKTRWDSKDNLYIIVPRGECIGELKFQESCNVTQMEDNTLLADKEGITAQDTTSGKIWISIEVEINGEKANAFFVFE